MRDGHRAVWVGIGAVLLAVTAACGGGGTKSATGGAPTSATSALPTTTATAGTAQPTAPPSTTTKPRPRVAYPGGGAVDPVNPPDDPAYTLLVQGQCQQLLDKTHAWDSQGVANAEGADTVFVYRSAAEACLQRWTDALADFNRLTKPKPDFGTNCARTAAYEWVAALVAARRQDPQYTPVFVASNTKSPCASSGTTTSSTTAKAAATTTTTR